MTNKNKVINKINDIIIELQSIDTSEFKFGLFDGKIGISLFYFYLDKVLEKTTYSKSANDLILKALKKDKSSNLFSSSYCMGVTGLCWTLEHLIQNNFINRDGTEDVIVQFDKMLYDKMIKDISNGSYDYLYGATGIGNYFLKRSRYKKKCKDYVYNLIDKLNEISVCENDGYNKWESLVYNEEWRKGYNFSLSHGISSIIIFLSRALNEGINEELCIKLLNGSINYLLKYYNHDINTKSVFPSYICLEDKFSKYESRLSWCYGDLGIAYAFYTASKALKNKEIESVSIQIFLTASNRRDLKKENVIDGGLCHGSSGIAHIYARMYRSTGIKEFNETANFWFNETLKMAKFKDCKSGYKVWFPKETGGPRVDYGILEGISGIGLALLFWGRNSAPDWDECLLLS